jgi:hypothetical protein
MLRHLTFLLTMLSIAYTHVDTQFLMPFRLWHTQLQQKYPRWAAADVAPKHGQTWKELVAVATKLEAPAAPDLSIDLHARSNCPVAEYTEYWNSGGLSLLHDCSDCADMDERHTHILLCIIFTACVTCCLAHCDMVITLGLSQSLLSAVMPCDCNFSTKSVRQGLQTN